MTIVDGKYELIRLLGEGGMGSVHEARHVGTGRRVAVKLISPEAMLKSSDIGARFEREARATGQLESRHVTHTLDTGRDAETGRPYLVMELLRGEDVAQAVERLGPLAADTVLRAIAQALTGLQKAHEAGIVHRDIKPANLFLSHGETDGIVVKILDFGIAKVRADPLSAERREDVALTRTGSMLGSPLYMSPEQARSAKNLDHRCDLWSIGVVMYEALSGFTPYGEVDTLGGLILEICSGRQRNVQDHAPWISAEIAQITYRALHPDIEKRYQSAQEMLEDIRRQIPKLSGLMLTALTPAMLTGVGPEARGRLATRLATSGSMVSPFAQTEGSMPSLPEAAISQSRLPGSTSTHSSFAQSTSTARRFPLVATLGIGAVVLAAGAFGVTRLLPKPTAAAASSAPVAPPSIVPTAIDVAPAVTASAPPVASSAPSIASAPIASATPSSRPTASGKAATRPPATAPSASAPHGSGEGESRKFD
jgi:serine/threonine-protein kinase